MYELALTIQDEHIDFQNILAGLYYPFYFQECRHRFLAEEIGIDVYEYAKLGLNLVLVEYHLKFTISLRKQDALTVTCQLLSVPGSRAKTIFDQHIYVKDKLAAKGSFVGTCISTSGGRPYIPQEIKSKL